MNSVELDLRRARREWIAGAARVHYGRCETCLNTRTADDRPLLVARQPRRRRFECFNCHIGVAPPRPAAESF